MRFQKLKNMMGVTFDQEKKQFLFDFTHDNECDVVKLTGEIQQVEAFGKCFYYGYEFTDQIEGSVRSAFIKYVKFSNSIQDDPNLAQFVQKAINQFHRQCNLYNYDLVVMPESSSLLNQYMLRYVYRFAQPSLHQMELVKALPESISFDMDAYERQYLDAVLENGRPRYTEAQKDEVRASIANMMDAIHRKDYFTIAKDVKKSKMRPYIMNFLQFKNEQDKMLCESIRRQNILIMDDVTTSGSTLNEILRTLRILNDDNQIVVFSLIGRKDLMADSV